MDVQTNGGKSVLYTSWAVCHVICAMMIEDWFNDFAHNLIPQIASSLSQYLYTQFTWNLSDYDTIQIFAHVGFHETLIFVTSTLYSTHPTHRVLTEQSFMCFLRTG